MRVLDECWDNLLATMLGGYEVMKVAEQRPLLANVKMGAFATVFGFVLAFIAWTLWRLKPELPPLFDAA